MARLPSLHALRLFEAAARLGSFTKAGEEIGLTQSAVSKQIAGLEDVWGRQLFKRSHKRIELTDLGKKMHRVILKNLAQLEAELDQVIEDYPRHIRLTCDADFAQTWLFHHLPDFKEKHPDITLAIQTETSLQQPPASGYDCALLWGRGNWSSCRFEVLFSNMVFPVASPAFMKSHPEIHTLADVPNDLIIHDRSTHWWDSLFRASGSERHITGGYLYSSTAMCLDAAIRGDGITMGDEVSSRYDLEQGQLIIPFNHISHRLPSPDSYYIITPSTENFSESVLLFIQWIRGQAMAQYEAARVMFES